MVSGVGQPAAFAYVLLAEHLRPRQTEPAVRAEVQAAMEALLTTVNREQADYARLQMIVIASEAWSIENGLLTPTLKIKRSRVEAVIATQVDHWYAAGTRVVWQ